MMTAASLEKSLLLAGAYDWISFAELIGFVKEESPHADDATLRERAITVSEDFSRRGLWRAGDVTTAGFKGWNSTPEEGTDRMREELRKLHRPALPGDVCWFQVTDQGLSILSKMKKEPNQALEPTAAAGRGSS